MRTDPLAPLVDLPGVADAATRASDALAAVHRHPVNLKGWAKTATEAAWRAGRSSAAIEAAEGRTAGAPAAAAFAGGLARDGEITDPALAGAMRVAQELDGGAPGRCLSTWSRAPLQALARLHVLAASDLVDGPDALGRPRAGAGERLAMLGEIAAASTAPAPVIAAVVHGDLLSLRPFGSADGVVARGASRLVCAGTGLDPHGLGVPEVTWLKRGEAYRELAAGFGSGDPSAVAAWIVFCCDAFADGAREARSIADAARG